MRSVVAASVLAVLVVLVPGPPADAQAPEDVEELEAPGGVLYLTPERLSTDGDATCPGGLPRYAMTNNGTNLQEEAVLPAPLSTPYRTCATRFTYDVSSTFTLGKTVNVTLWMRCDAPSVSVPTRGVVRFVLTDVPGYQESRDPIAMAERIQESYHAGPTVCDGSPFSIEAEVDAHQLELQSGDTLTLFTWIYYPTPVEGTARTVEFLLGGDDPSRIEGAGIPAPGEEGAATVHDARPTLLMAGEASDNEYLSCDAMAPAYALLPERDGAAEGAVPMTAATGAESGCPTWFEYVVAQPLTLMGTATVGLWYKCEFPAYGSPDDFAVELQIVRNATDDTTGVGYDYDVLATGRTGSSGSLAPCPSSPVATPAAGLALEGSVAFEKGERIRLAIYPHYVNAPRTLEAAQNVHVLVGGQHASYLSVAGLPWSRTLPDERESEAGLDLDAPARQDAPGPSLALVGTCILAGLALCKAHSRHESRRR